MQQAVERERDDLSGNSSFEKLPAGFQVDFEVRLSNISPEIGLGIFTKQFIPNGSLIWKYSRGSNVISYANEQEVKTKLEKLNQHECEFFMSHVYLFDGFMNEILDSGKYWNHSETPNTGYGPGLNSDWQSSYAIRDIEAGEELLDDYGVYEYPDWFVKLAEEYHTPQDFITKKDSQKPGFHVTYELKASDIGGVGLFAKTFIKKNTLIWKYGIDRNIKVFYNDVDVRDHLSKMQDFNQKYSWISHVYVSDGHLNEIMDDGKYWNHSEEPNTVSGVNGDWDSTFAKRDILPGEELLDDYGLYDYPEWFLKLYEEYKVPYDFITMKS